MDPYVKIRLDIPVWPYLGPPASSALSLSSGISPSQGGLDRSVEAETAVVRNNGFNPVWDQVLEMPFDCLAGMKELIFMRVQVKDKDVDRDGFVGTYCASLGTLELGMYT